MAPKDKKNDDKKKKQPWYQDMFSRLATTLGGETKNWKTYMYVTVLLIFFIVMCSSCVSFLFVMNTEKGGGRRRGD